MIKPIVLSIVTYRSMRRKQFLGVKRSGQCTSLRQALETVRLKKSDQHQVAGGLGWMIWRTYVNCHLNRRYSRRAQDAGRLSQKGCDQIWPCKLAIHRHQTSPAERQRLSHSYVSHKEHSNPVYSLKDSNRHRLEFFGTVGPQGFTYGYAGEGLGKKRMFPCNEGNRGLRHGLTPKGGRRSQGLFLRESLVNLFKRESR